MTVQVRKDEQGWTKNTPRCSNCAEFSSEEVVTDYGWKEEKKSNVCSATLLPKRRHGASGGTGKRWNDEKSRM